MLRCQTPVASDPHKRAQWNTRDVNWQALSQAVEDSVRSFHVQDINPPPAHTTSQQSHDFCSSKVKTPQEDYGQPWPNPALRYVIKQRNTLRRVVQSNRVEYLAACGDVRRLSVEARRPKWEKFLADLEGNTDPARAWNLVKSPSGSPPHSTVFCEPLILSGRTFLANTRKVNAFVQLYAAVNRLSFDKRERTQARHLKKALQIPCASESFCSGFTFR